MKTSMVRAQNHVPEGDVREVRLFGLKKESICGNMRGVLKHWKDPHLKEQYLLHEAPENKTGTNKSNMEANDNPMSETVV